MIPKIIHQLWIGQKPAPTKFMDSWKDKNPDFEYIRWNEEELEKRSMQLECVERINEMEEINGKADIIRWEILYKYGGVFIDADSICIEPIDNILMETQAFAGWEQEQIRKGLVATGTMGFPPKHPLIRAAIDWIKINCVSVQKTGKRAWITVGPGLLTTMYNTGKYNMTIFPSYSFLPIHCTGLEYNGHGKIYAFQEWGSTKNNYEIMNNINLPSQFLIPKNGVSIVIPSLNTKASYVQQCLDSIKHQQGYFNMEIIWINDGSDQLNTTLLEKLLKNFEETTRFTSIKYIKNETNKGLGYSLNKGVIESSHEIILRMDADDIMYPDRISKQISFMKENEDCVLCGAQVNMVKLINNQLMSTGITSHNNIDVDKFLQSKPHWIMNHPTFCFRKKQIIEAGNYNDQIHSMCEDFELILRVLKKYGKIYNIQEPLLYYRLHEEQVTYGGGKEGSLFWTEKRNKLIEDILIKNDNDVTMVLTSCNRPNELKITLQSFFKFNTYPLKKIIIIDDSGKKGCIDECLSFIPSHVNKTIIYNDKNIGQIKSIDKAYSLVETEFIFHCEDDWEFYDYGFIEKSMDILNSNENICLVWLRPYKNGILSQNGHPIDMNIVNNYRIVSNNFLNQWMGFSFNPGLRRLSDYKLIGHYSKFNEIDHNINIVNGELNIQAAYKKLNKFVVITLKEEGYVKHIGWNNSTQYAHNLKKLIE
tara:strand:+ start:4611 stop:6725 length:2115 start_codon:yes stop_codon:yes gene_type:complete